MLQCRYACSMDVGRWVAVPCQAALLLLLLLLYLAA
jgi:hypothetical protein